MTVPPDQSRAAEIAVSRHDLELIAGAMRTVLTGRANRIEGEGWKVYLAGTILRIDLEAS